MIPEYILKLLDQYGNAYMSPMLISKCGGIDAVIANLKDKGFDCIAETKIINMRDFGSGELLRSIDTIISIRRDK